MTANPIKNPDFFALLLKIDQSTADSLRQKGCPECGGPLHWANYARSPRGLPSGCATEHSTRLSLCCGREGCRKRLTPPSVRFLGQKVYVGAAVVLYATMCHGVTPARVGQLHHMFGVGRQTLVRWRKWWLNDFVSSRFWKWGKGMLSPPPDTASLPVTLMERFSGTLSDRILQLLRFIAPITGTPTPSSHAF
jgi:hypothetical protein